jgi:hypothetical protein
MFSRILALPSPMMMLLSSSTIHWLDFNFSFAIIFSPQTVTQKDLFITETQNGPEGWKAMRPEGLEAKNNSSLQAS